MEEDLEFIKLDLNKKETLISAINDNSLIIYTLSILFFCEGFIY